MNPAKFQKQSVKPFFGIRLRHAQIHLGIFILTVIEKYIVHIVIEQKIYKEENYFLRYAYAQQ